MVNKELLKSLTDMAGSLATYRGQLIKAGFTAGEALQVAIAYQGQLIQAGMMADLERKKNESFAFTIGKFPPQ